MPPSLSWFVGGLLLAFGSGTCLDAEDADRVRGYFRFSSGDVEPLWGVDEHWSLGLGFNFNRYFGAELAFDYYLKDWGKPEPVGEASSDHFIPELRLRYPLLKDRLVPYLIAGAGPSWIQGKDVKSSAFGQNVSLEGYSFGIAAIAGLDLEGDTLHPAANVGGGVEYFITRNFSLKADAPGLIPGTTGLGSRTTCARLRATTPSSPQPSAFGFTCSISKRDVTH